MYIHIYFKILNGLYYLYTLEKNNTSPLCIHVHANASSTTPFYTYVGFGHGMKSGHPLHGVSGISMCLVPPKT